MIIVKILKIGRYEFLVEYKGRRYFVHYSEIRTNDNMTGIVTSENALVTAH